MRRRAARRLQWAAWIGLLALALQALAPLATAAALRLSWPEDGRSLAMCLYGTDRASEFGNEDPGSGKWHDLALGSCAMCLAFHPAPALPAPVAPILRVPSIHLIALPRATTDRATAAIGTRPYRSRAPPLAG